MIRLLIKKLLWEYHLIEMPARKWSEESLRDEALKYDTLKDFRTTNNSAYNSAKNKGDDFFKEITSHMKILKRNKYSDDELRNIAQKYKTKSEFLKSEVGAWDASYKKGPEFYNSITSHMEDGRQNKTTKYSDDILKNLISNYTDFTEFRKDNEQAYYAILRKTREEQEELLKNLHRKKSKTLSRDEIIDISKKYTKLGDFWKNDRQAVVTAKKIGDDFFKEITSHMTRGRRDGITDQELYDIAKKYDDLTDFYTKEPATYALLKSRKLLKSAISHMHRDRENWTKDDLVNISKNFDNLRDFRNSYENLYAWALNNIPEVERKEIFTHFQPLGNLKKRLIYSFEFPDNSVYVGLTFDSDGRYKQHQQNVKSAVKKYQTQTGLTPVFKKLTDYVSDTEAIKSEYEFVKNYRNNGWKILNIAKTGGLGSIPIKWTYDVLRKEALKYKSRREFQLKNPKAYGAALRYKIMDDITKHMGKRKNEKISSENLIKIAKEYDNLKTFREREPNIYQLILKRNLLEPATSHMERKYNFLSDDELRDIAQKYKSKVDFLTNDLAAYTQASRRGILDIITSHYKKTRESWTIDKIKKIASTYEKVSDFKKTPAYQAAHRMGILDDVTKHMVRGKMFGKNIK